MKTTQNDFELFKKYCLEYQKFFGLTNFKFYFYFEYGNSGKHAIINCGELQDYIATFTFYEDWGDEIVDEKEIDKIAFHEVCHVLLVRLNAIANSRFITEDEIREAEHEIIRRLENSIFNLK